MSKERKSHREDKKKATMTPKEKRLPRSPERNPGISWANTEFSGCDQVGYGVGLTGGSCAWGVRAQALF
jgi:hypothetical protein